MNRLALLVVLLAFGCTSKKPSIERDPGRYTPAETDARKVTRLEERIKASEERVDGWIRDLETRRGLASDPAKVDAALEKLRGQRRELERLRTSANEVETRGAKAEDLEREALGVEAAAERAHREGVEAIPSPPGAAGPR